MDITFGSLFSGIGGIDLGLERAGMRVRWQSENDPYASRVLAKHWPTTPNLGDITQIEWSGIERVDLVCGGFPCTDISVLGQRAGLAGQHSGLWSSFRTAIRELRPHYVLVENVPSLLVRGMGTVLGDLARMGYDAEWGCVPAAAIGAPHLRAREWIVGYSRRDRHQLEEGTIFAGRRCALNDAWWATEPDVGRVADGLPARVDRLRTLGNAVVPQVAEWIGQRILESAT